MPKEIMAVAHTTRKTHTPSPRPLTPADRESPTHRACVVEAALQAAEHELGGVHGDAARSQKPRAVAHEALPRMINTGGP